MVRSPFWPIKSQGLFIREKPKDRLSDGLKYGEELIKRSKTIREKEEEEKKPKNWSKPSLDSTEKKS